MKKFLAHTVFGLSCIFGCVGASFLIASMVTPEFFGALAPATFFAGLASTVFGGWLSGPAGHFAFEAERAAMLAKQTWTPRKAPLFWRG